MSETLEMAVEGFLAHKRGIGRKYHSEEYELRAARPLRRAAWCLRGSAS